MRMSRLQGYRQSNVRLFFYLRGLCNLLLPSARQARTLVARHREASMAEQDYVQQRAEYYLKRRTPFALDASATSIQEFRTAWKHRQPSAYFFDLHDYLRHFDRNLRFFYRFGDNFAVPAEPTFVKARTLAGDNANAVLLKLDKLRHYKFVTDRLGFEDKRDQMVWRGNAARPHRQKVVQQFHHHPLCNVGQTNPRPEAPASVKPYLSIWDQLRYKFILSIEGNDVATNLKWIMSSNSVCFMTRPTRETWFMEGQLIPDHHYVLLRDDYSDLEEKIRFYSAHPELAREVTRHANDYVAQFCDEGRETIIALRVLDRYFALSGQSPTLGLDIRRSSAAQSRT